MTITDDNDRVLERLRAQMVAVWMEMDAAATWYTNRASDTSAPAQPQDPMMEMYDTWSRMLVSEFKVVKACVEARTNGTPPHEGERRLAELEAKRCDFRGRWDAARRDAENTRVMNKLRARMATILQELDMVMAAFVTLNSSTARSDEQNLKMKVVVSMAKILKSELEIIMMCITASAREVPLIECEADLTELQANHRDFLRRWSTA